MIIVLKSNSDLYRLLMLKSAQKAKRKAWQNWKEKLSALQLQREKKWAKSEVKQHNPDFDYNHADIEDAVINTLHEVTEFEGLGGVWSTAYFGLVFTLPTYIKKGKR